VTIDYREAPYHQFPAASEDVEKVYRALLETYKPEAIGIYGCSAGGLLSAQSIARFQVKGLPRPGAVGIFCASAQPFSAKRGDSDMWGPTGSGPLPPNSNVLAQLQSPRAYFATAKPDDPLAYPGVSDAVISKFPPTLFVTGTRAMEMSSAVTSHAQFLRLGVDSQLYVMEAGWHGAFVIDGQATPEGKATIAYIAHWFDQKLAR
jgi:monoterpene epsilon-lactone hydrolase